MSGPIFLLDLEWAGRTWKISSSEYEGYYHGLGIPDISEDTPLGSQVGYRSVSITALIPADVAALVAQGWPLSTGTATLQISIDGEVEVWAKGLVSGAVVNPGSQGLVSFTIEGGPWAQTNAWPPTSHVVSLDTFPNADDAAIGKAYPQVYGRPGRGDVNGTTRIPGSPGVVVQTTGNARLMICEGAVSATQVQITDSAVGGWATHSVLYGTDSNGVLYAYVELTTGTTPYVAGHSYYVSWGYTADGGLGAKSSGVREVLRDALGRTSVGCDTGKTLSAPRLDTELSFYIDEVVDPWAWVKALLFPILPISIYSGQRGAYPVVWDFEAGAEGTGLALVSGQNAARLGPWEESPTRNVISEVFLEYAVDAATGAYRKTLLLKAPISRYGSATLALKSDVIWDEGVATQIAQGLLRRNSHTSRRSSYGVGQRVKVSVGDVVALTDPDYYLEDAPCIVEGVSIEGGYKALSLLLLRG